MSASALGSSVAPLWRRLRALTSRVGAPMLSTIACFSVAVGAVLPRSATAHPYHVTFAEAKLDETTWSLQLAIRMKPEDLEEAIRRSSGVDGRLDDFPNREDHAYRYLTSKLSFDRQDAPPLPIRWVGMEVSLRDAWVYLEVPLPSATRQLTVRNDIFFDLEINQANTVELRLPSGQTTLTFRRDQSTALVEIPAHTAR